MKIKYLTEDVKSVKRTPENDRDNLGDIFSYVKKVIKCFFILNSVIHAYGQYPKYLDDAILTSYFVK